MEEEDLVSRRGSEAGYRDNSLGSGGINCLVPRDYDVAASACPDLRIRRRAAVGNDCPVEAARALGA